MEYRLGSWEAAHLIREYRYECAGSPPSKVPVAESCCHWPRFGYKEDLEHPREPEPQVGPQRLSLVHSAIPTRHLPCRDANRYAGRQLSDRGD
jgi:hypothetical protein